MHELWIVTQIAKEFHVLPSVARADFLDDVEGSALAALTLLRYSEAKQAFDSAESDEALKPWKESRMMETVKANTFSLHKARVARRGRR